jgi:hypothetical protein
MTMPDPYELHTRLDILNVIEEKLQDSVHASRLTPGQSPDDSRNVDMRRYHLIKIKAATEELQAAMAALMQDYVYAKLVPYLGLATALRGDRVLLLAMTALNGMYDNFEAALAQTLVDAEALTDLDRPGNFEAVDSRGNVCYLMRAWKRDAFWRLTSYEFNGDIQGPARLLHVTSIMQFNVEDLLTKSTGFLRLDWEGLDDLVPFLQLYSYYAFHRRLKLARFKRSYVAFVCVFVVCIVTCGTMPKPTA